jgi:hypothetical protein
VKAAPIFIAFFIMFTAASIAVPVPLFPGNLVASFLNIPFLEYAIYIEAITNGITYGVVIWFVFFLIGKKLDDSVPLDSKKRAFR